MVVTAHVNEQHLLSLSYSAGVFVCLNVIYKVRQGISPAKSYLCQLELQNLLVTCQDLQTKPLIKINVH